MLFFKASIYLSLYLRRIVREHIDCPLLQIGPRFWAKVLQAAPKSRKWHKWQTPPLISEHNSEQKRTQFVPVPWKVLTLRTSSIQCCQSSDRRHNIDQRSLTVSIWRLRFCAMRARGESFGSSEARSVSYSSKTLRPSSRARSTTSRLTLSLPLKAYTKETKKSYINSSFHYKRNPKKAFRNFLLSSHSFDILSYLPETFFLNLR